MEIIARGIVQGRKRIVSPAFQHIGIQGIFEGIQVVGSSNGLFFIVESVQAYILNTSDSRGIVEGVHTYGFVGYFTPDGFGHIALIAAHRQAVFERFAAILEHIFRNFTQIEIQISSGVHTQTVVNKGVHQPKLNVFHIGCFEIGHARFYSTHDSSPALFRIGQSAIGLHAFRIEIIRPPLFRVIRNIHHRQQTRLIKLQITVGIDFFFVDRPHIVIGQLLIVVADMIGGLRTALSKYLIDSVPGHQCTVHAIAQIVGIGSFGKQSSHGVVRSTGQKPLSNISQAESLFGGFKIVHVNGIVYLFGGTRLQLSYFSLDR